jgi:hypothetical protein
MEDEEAAVGVEKTAWKPGDRERAAPSEREDPFPYRNTYHIITALVLCAAAPPPQLGWGRCSST